MQASFDLLPQFLFLVLVERCFVRLVLRLLNRQRTVVSDSDEFVDFCRSESFILEIVSKNESLVFVRQIRIIDCYRHSLAV